MYWTNAVFTTNDNAVNLPEQANTTRFSAHKTIDAGYLIVIY